MRISVRVRPNARKQEVTRISDAEYKVLLKKSPEDNAANIELLKLLTRYFKKKVIILKGKTSKNKIIEVFDG
jgi:uncharacterized protein (TIGR00251 family)